MKVLKVLGHHDTRVSLWPGHTMIPSQGKWHCLQSSFQAMVSPPLPPATSLFPLISADENVWLPSDQILTHSQPTIRGSKYHSRLLNDYATSGICTPEMFFLQGHISNSISVKQTEQVPFAFYTSQKRPTARVIIQPVNKARTRWQILQSWF